MRQDSTVQTVKWWEASGAATFNGACARPPRKRCMTHATTSLETRLWLLADTGRSRGICLESSHNQWLRSEAASSQNRYSRTGGRRTSQGIAYTNAAPRSDRPCTSEHARARARTRVLAYRAANGPSLLTKQAQHSTDQYYPQSSNYIIVAVMRCVNLNGTWISFANLLGYWGFVSILFIVGNRRGREMIRELKNCIN